MRRKICGLLIGLILIAMVVLACEAGIETASGYDNQAIEMLQKKVPFTIITPAYFPEGIIHYPSVIFEPGKGSTENSIVVGFTYKKTRSTNMIIITEENCDAIWEPSTENSAFLDISGIQVLEEESNPNHATGFQDGFSYGWNMNGIHIGVEIHGYSNIECRKVIESMIK